MVRNQNVFVGLSGGVDSSVAAARLVRAGHTVTGVFIKVWQPDFLACNWEAERIDAMRVCAHLGIPFLTFDAAARYKRDVVDYLVREYRAGRTPNPDVMCNQHVKFGAFLEFARTHGADCVATGHYARTRTRGGRTELLRGVDASKDQSYFLWTLSSEQLTHIVFPIGNTVKHDVRREAQRLGIPTARKPDSQGVCFLGELDMREFLSHFIPQETGAVLDRAGRHIGTHEGAALYTIGQRHGITITATAPDDRPYYVIAKDMERNTLTVSHERPIVRADASYIELMDTNWLTEDLPASVLVQTRYHGPCTRGAVENIDGMRARVHLHAPAEAPAAGQSCVIYDHDRLIGGGIVCE